MTRPDNGGIIGPTNFTSSGTFTLRNQFVNNNYGIWPRGGATNVIAPTKTSPYVQAYVWSTAGWGSKYSAPGSTINNFSGVAGKNDMGTTGSDAFFSGGNSSSAIYGYYAFSAAGFGTLYSGAPSISTTVGTNGQSIATNKQSNSDFALTLGGASSAANQLRTGQYTPGSGWGSLYSTPTGAQSSLNAYIFRFNNQGTYIASGTASSFYFQVWPFTSGTGTGTVYGNPSIGSGSTVEDLNWSADGNTLFLMTTNSAYVTYPFTPGIGLGSQFASINPGLGSGTSIAVTNTINNMDVAGGVFLTTPHIKVYPYNTSSGFGSAYSDPGTVPNISSSGGGVSFDQNNKTLFVSFNVSPYLYAYNWTYGVGFGSLYSNPGTLPVGALSYHKFFTL